MDKPTEVKRLLEHAKSLRLPHENEIKDAYLHTFPAREFDREQGQEVDRTKLYDATAVGAVTDLRTTTIRLLVPQNRPWASIAFKTELLKEKLATQFAPILNDANEKLFTHFRTSNFYLALGESLIDAIVGGTGCLAFVDGDDGLSYMSIPTSQLYFLEDHKGVVDATFREHQMTARQVVSRFATVGEKYRSIADEHPDKKIKLVEAVIPDGGQFRYCVYDGQDWEPLEDTRSQWNPFVVWRWSRQVGEVWGEGPVRHALPHIRSINIMSKSRDVAGEYASLGLWQVQDESVNVAALQSRMTPGGVINIDTELKPVQFPGNFNISEAMIGDQRQQIRTLLHANLAVRQDGENTYMTAAEVEARTGQFMEQVGEPARRLQFELLQPVAEQAVGRLQQRGELPRVPAEYIRQIMPGARDQRDLLKVEVNAAITKAMRQQQAREDVTVWATGVQSLPPGIAEKHINVDKLARLFFTHAGIDPSVMRSESEVAQIEQQQAQAQQMQQLLAAADTQAGKAAVQGVMQGQQQAAA